MLHSTKFEAIAIVGQTASGKAEIAVKISRILRKIGKEVELISCDSRKVYKYFDIGTAKPTQFLQEFRWHFIDVIEPDQNFSAKRFEKEGRKIIKEIKSAGKIPIVVGGTWLYIRALERGFEDEPEDENIRSQLEDILKKEGKMGLWNLLKNLDPKAAEKIHPSDSYRVRRSLEFKLKTGKSILDARFKEDIGQRFPILKVAIFRNKEEILERIRSRVLKQIQRGLIEETKMLYEKFGETTPLLKSIAYWEPYLYITGKISFEDMINLMIKRNFRYSKYQVKVFSREGTLWFDEEEKLISFAVDFYLNSENFSF
jgi:tRNA dimethylallyltransferase